MSNATQQLNRAIFAYENQPNPWEDDAPDYTAIYQDRVDAWLADPGHTEAVSELLASDESGARLLRTLVTDLHDRVRGATPEGDLIKDMRLTIRALGNRAAELAYTPICADIDAEARQAADARQQMARYGEVVS